MVSSPIVPPPEPVSPELVLVDPELARRERARLTAAALQQALHEIAMLQERVAAAPERRAVEAEHAPAPWTARKSRFVRRRVLPAAVVCAIAVIAVLPFLGGSRERSASADSSGSTATRATYGVLGVRTPVRGGPAIDASLVAAGRALRRRTRVEDKIASLILAAPPAKLPRAFVDRHTRRVRSTVTVTCRPRHRAFLCVARVPNDARTNGIVVAYRYRGAGGVFAWYGYQRVRA